jgi:hypothetical protein
MRITRRGALAALALVLAATGGGGRADALLGDAESVIGTSNAAASFGGTVYYLHNNPTPPSGGTAAQANLAMNTSAPTATTLHNYDTDLDAQPGRTIQRGGSGAAETDLAQYANWRGPTAGLLGQTINGTVTVELWTAVDGFSAGGAGEVQVFLRDILVLTGTASEIASASVAAADWHGATSGWVKQVVTLNVAHTLLVGHALELKVIAGPTAGADMMLAYDTTAYRSRLRLP